jgi:hypothetical protein
MRVSQSCKNREVEAPRWGEERGKTRPPPRPSQKILFRSRGFFLRSCEAEARWHLLMPHLIEEMLRSIESGSAKSAEDAAGKVAARAAGINTTFESKRTRLARRYRKQFPAERN